VSQLNLCKHRGDQVYQATLSGCCVIGALDFPLSEVSRLFGELKSAFASKRNANRSGTSRGLIHTHSEHRVEMKAMEISTRGGPALCLFISNGLTRRARHQATSEKRKKSKRGK
jgi:hypothetical protein